MLGGFFVKYWKELINCHIKENWFLYITVLVFFIGGITFGALGVKVLNEEQTTELTTYLNHFFDKIPQLEGQRVAFKSIMDNLNVLIIIYILGMTVIGSPAILFITFTRGFIIGFTIGFLVQERGLRGILLSIVSVLPQNIFFVPAIIGSSVCALAFSIYLVKGRSDFKRNLVQQFLAYSTGMAVFFVLAFCYFDAFSP
jgi:stage II sporulation protein M